jgi:type IV pilus assembly protein PilQ
LWSALIAVAIVSLLVNHQIVAAELPLGRVENIEVEKTNTQVRIIITASENVRYEVLELDAPPRLVIDLHNAIYAVTQKTIAVGHKTVLQIRSGQFLDAPEKVVRVAVDLKSSCPYTITQVKNQIVVTLFLDGNDRTAKRSNSDSTSARSNPPKEQLISLNLQGVTLENALKILTKKTGLNFLMSSDLSGMKINVYLRGVPVQGAIQTILKANGLWYERQEGTNIYVITKIKGSPPAETVTEIIRCDYATVADLGRIITENLTRDGSFTVDKRTNSVIVTDTPSNIARLRNILSELDSPSRQVLIEVKIVEINLTAANELGISWDWTGKGGESSPVGAAILKGSFSSVTEGLLNLSIGKYASNVGVRDLKSAITALEKRGWAEMLASPKVLALDGKPASIKITEHIALARKVTYQGTVGSQVAVEEPIFGDIGITLTVTPHVLNEKFTILDVKPTVSSAHKSTYFPGQAVDTQERTAETSVMVEDGQTIVIGGLFRNDEKKTVARLPLLGNIPILGYLFRKTITDTIKTEVTVFLTPHIITTEKY